MGDTDIEWAEKSWNPATGCAPVSEGCANCYAAKMAKRLQAIGTPGYEKGFAVTLHEDKLAEPLRWRKPRIVFVDSMGDICHEEVKTDWILRILTVVALCPQHRFLLLTKRPERLFKVLDAPSCFGFGNHYGYFIDCAHELLGVPEGTIDDSIEPRIRAAMDAGLKAAGLSEGTVLPNLGLGVSAENQRYADERIPLLLQCPAAMRFVSLEPLLGPIELNRWLRQPIWHGSPDHPQYGVSFRSMLDWVIVGGESGPKARPMELDWVRAIRDDCAAARVPLFIKQLGSHWAKANQARHPKGGDPAEWPAEFQEPKYREPIWNAGANHGD